MQLSIADQNAGAAPVRSISTTEWERKEEGEEGSTAVMCLFTFVGTAAATLIICGLTPVRPLPEGWHRLVSDRPSPTAAKGNAKGASAASRSSLL